MPVTKDELLLSERMRAASTQTLLCIGAHVGDGIAFYARTTTVSKIIAIEPDKDCFAELVERFGLSGRVECINAAIVAGNTKNTILYVAPGDVKFKRSNSVVVARKPDYYAVVVPAKNMNEFITHGCAVKFDCEGAEYDLLMMPDVSQIKFILVLIKMHPKPFNTFNYAKKREIIYKHLQSLGFVCLYAERDKNLIHMRMVWERF